MCEPGEGDCGKEALPQLKVCDVCRIIDGDKSLKMCRLCVSCNAFICEPDITRYDRRGVAFLGRVINGITKFKERIGS